MQRCTFEDIEALNSMTLQVGLRGNDGIVLASDRLTYGWQGIKDRNRSMISKFYRGNGFICCYSGDDVAKFAAANACKLSIERDVKDQSEERKKEIIREALQSAGTTAWTQIFGNQTEGTATGAIRKVIVACTEWSSSYPLWLLEYTNQFPMATPKGDRVVAGDERNSASLFITDYLPWGGVPIPLPVNRLIFAAAHAIFAGARDNPTGVGGLEMYVIPNLGSPIHLEAQQEWELERLSAALDGTIRAQLLQPFDYANTEQ